MLVWTIAMGDSTARVAENGDVDGDPRLVAVLRDKLTQPVVVFRHGTVRNLPGAEPHEIELSPGDGRYTVARIRRLCADESEFAVLGCEWR